ncbi:DUF2294 domain-containing protein [Almyronema epifaneia]|uniref:DUF2294 domain-containing protein n=1 Tax=Almyronema epifaneia S1 TaxID=2991925 RepID=A0ABW6IGB3_9CYAN
MAEIKEAPQTAQQLEQSLSRAIESLYISKLGQQPSQITCQFFEAKLAIVLEESLTHLEQLLIGAEQNKTAQRMRATLNRSLQNRISRLLEEMAGVAVIDFLSSTTFATRRTGIIVVFQDAPAVNNPYVIPKYKSLKSTKD